MWQDVTLAYTHVEQALAMMACYTKCTCSGQNPIITKGNYTDAAPDNVCEPRRDHTLRNESYFTSINS